MKTELSEIPLMMPTANILEFAIEDVLRPLEEITRIFWVFNKRPESEEQEAIIGLCMLIEDAACQIKYLIEHSSIKGQCVASASVDHPYTKRVLVRKSKKARN